MTAAEIAARQAEQTAGQAAADARAVLDANAATIRTKLAAQVAANSPARTAVANNTTYIGITSPTNAQVAAQVKALTNQNNVIIPALLRLARLALSQLDADA